jgi:hypothetical protein
MEVFALFMDWEALLVSDRPIATLASYLYPTARDIYHTPRPLTLLRDRIGGAINWDLSRHCRPRGIGLT